jgi:hypothetical protein
MKKKIQLGPFKLKLSFGKKKKLPINKKNNFVAPDPVKLLEYKLYRIFKEQYCEFFHAHSYGVHGTEPSCYIYYRDKNNNDSKYLIGEFMFGEDKIQFFKRKGILIKESIENYQIVQEERVLAVYDKEWIEEQRVYQ